jgi:hypothetical protein
LSLPQADVMTTAPRRQSHPTYLWFYSLFWSSCMHNSISLPLFLRYLWKKERIVSGETKNPFTDISNFFSGSLKCRTWVHFVNQFRPNLSTYSPWNRHVT